MTIQTSPSPMTPMAPIRLALGASVFRAPVIASPTLRADQFAFSTASAPQTADVVAEPSIWDKLNPKDHASSIAFTVGGGALIAGGIGAGVAALAGGTVLTGLAIGAGVGLLLGGAAYVALRLIRFT